MDIAELIRNGYFLKDATNSFSNIALLSLKNALASYFHTATEVNLLLSMFKLDKMKQSEIDENHGIKYAGYACDAISHFHHFTELFF